jgi:hypothetical protein
LIAGIVILAVGFLLARLLNRLAVPVLHRIGFDRLASRHRLIEDRPYTRSGSIGGGQVVFWVVMLVTVQAAARALRLNYIADGLGRVIAYLPHVLGAAVIFGAALLFGDWVRDRMRTRATEHTAVANSNLAPGAVRAGILALGGFMALRELLIAPQIVTIAFTLALGAIAIATALAFGLGGRKVAGQLTEDWYRGGDGLERPRRHMEGPEVGLREEEEPREPPVH